MSVVTKKKMSIRSIANQADVSPMTVSRTLNGHPGVKSATRNRILRFVQDTGYMYHERSKAVKQQRSKHVAIFCLSKHLLETGSDFNMYGQLYFMLVKQLKKIGIASHLYDFAEDAPDCLSKCGGAIMIDTPGAENFESIKRDYPHLKLIAVMNPKYDMHIPTVKGNNYQSGRLMAQHFIEKGYHKHVAIFSDNNNMAFLQRSSGFKDYYRLKKLQTQIDFIEYSNIDTAAGFDNEKTAALDEYFSGMEQLPTAFMATGCYSAIFLYKYLRKRGLDIPGDIGLAGFDNLGCYQALEQPLTRVYFDLNEIAALTVKRLREMFTSNDDTAYSLLTSPILIDKNSTQRRVK